MLDKEQASQAPLCSVISARSAGNYGSFCGFKNGVNIRAVISSLRSLSPNAYSHKEKNRGHTQKEDHYGKKEKFPLYLSPEKRPFWSAGIRRTGAGASPTSLSGRWTLSGLPQRQQRWIVSPYLHQVLSGRPVGPARRPDVLSAVQASGGAGSGGWYPRRRISVQRRGAAPTADGERPKCAEDQWLHLAGAAGAGDLGGWG